MTDVKPKTLGEALLAFQAEIPSLKLGKDASGQIAGNRAYKYLSLAKLHDEVLPLLNKHGLVWVTKPMAALREEGPILYYELFVAGNRDEAASGSFPLMLDKQNSQGLGSAITYARRYALTAVLGIVPDDDDDGAAASKTEVLRRPARPPAPAGVRKPDLSRKVAAWEERLADPTDRLMTPEEKAILLDAIDNSGKPDQLPLLLAKVGVDDEKDLTVAQGREMFKALSA